MPLDLITGLIEVANFGVKVAAKRARTRNEAKLAWDRAAAQLDTRREPDPQNDDWDRFVAVIDGFSITVDSVGGVDGLTRVRARSSAPGHERLKIYAAGTFSSLARAVGVVDVPLGDAAFDERFMVKGNDVEFARMWVNADVRKRIARVPDYRFELKSQRVAATKDGLETDAKTLVRAARAVAALAHGRQRILRSWRKLKGQYGGTLRREKGRWASLTGEHGGAAFTLDTYEHADQHFTKVVARPDKVRLPPFIIAHERHHIATTLPRVLNLEEGTGYRWFTEAPDRARAFFEETPIDTLRKLEVTKLRVDPELVTLLSPGICVNQKKLRELIALTCHISRGGDAGPYR